MATAESRMQILKMIENKQITAEDGAKLLEALDAEGQNVEAGSSSAAPFTQGRWFRVVVTDLRTGKRKVNVNIPLGLVDVGMKMGAKFAPVGLQGMDMKEVIAAIRAGKQGKVVDVEDEEDGEHVEIFVE